MSVRPHEEDFRITNYETDANAFWRYGSVFWFMQEAAERHADALGIGRRDTLAAFNGVWLLHSVRLEISRRPTEDETLHLTTWPKAMRRMVFPRDHLIADQQGKIIMAATTDWLLMDITTRRIIRSIPAQITALGFDEQRSATSQPIARPIVNEAIQFTTLERRQTRFSDLDCNGHLNNIQYINWLMDCYDQCHHRTHRLAVITAHYLHEQRLGDTVTLQIQRNPEYDLIRMLCDDGQPALMAQLEWVDA